MNQCSDRKCSLKSSTESEIHNTESLHMLTCSYLHYNNGLSFTYSRLRWLFGLSEEKKNIYFGSRYHLILVKGSGRYYTILFLTEAELGYTGGIWLTLIRIRNVEFVL